MPDSGARHEPEPPESGGSAYGDGVPPTGSASGPGDVSDRSLFEDIEDLLVDAKTYLDAEFSYQKTRAGFIGTQFKRVLVFAIAAAFIAILASIGLTVGLIIALVPLITGWGATAVVVGLWLFVAWLLIRKAAGAWGEIQGAIDANREAEDGDN